MPDLRRRRFITLLGGAAAWPLAARAQQAMKIPRIGIIDDAPRWKAFRHGLRDLGYLEGQNIAFDYAYGDGVPERLAEAAAALVRRPVDVIATFGTPASLAAKQATTTIPIVMISIGDPVRTGLVPNLARPGGNITGNTIIGPDVGAKRLQILKEVIPTVSRVAFLWNPDTLQCPSIRGATTCGTEVGCDGHLCKRGPSHRVRDRIRSNDEGAARCVRDDRRTLPSTPYRMDH
jgi:ABC transporter substrate binding protein